MILVLVDVDNLLGQLETMPAPGTLDPSRLLPAISGPSRSSAPVQVSMAMNLRSAAVFADWGALEQYGALLARRVAPWASETRPIEVALCLTVPEAADRALLRLFGHAPAETEGSIEEIWLLTMDGGLRACLRNILREHSYMEPVEMGTRWTLRESMRRSAPAGAVDLGEAALSLPRITARIDAPERCVSVAPRRVQCPGSWADLLGSLERNPWVLSQVGVTLHDGKGRGDGSVRGVARLRSCLSHEEPRLACAPEDGVEYGVEGGLGAWNLQVSRPTISGASIGPGAVRVEWNQDEQTWGLTLRSQLPAWLVAAEAKGIQATPSGEPRLDESLVLGKLAGPVGGPRARVRLAGYGGQLSAKITSPGELWWWQPSTDPWKVSSPRGTVKIDGAGRLLPARLDDIEAVQGVAPGSLLYLRSPLPPGTPVRLLSPLPRGLLGLAEYGDPSAPMRCAVLATCALQAGAVPCMPIQNATPGRLARALEHQGFSLLEAQGILPLLQELPLLVPVPAPRP